MKSNTRRLERQEYAEHSNTYFGTANSLLVVLSLSHTLRFQNPEFPQNPSQPIERWTKGNTETAIESIAD